MTDGGRDDDRVRSSYLATPDASEDCPTCGSSQTLDCHEDHPDGYRACLNCPQTWPLYESATS